MIAGRFFITPHAVRRYIERVRAGLSYEDALARLVTITEGAHRVREIGDGVELWRGPKPERLRLRVSTRGPGLPQVVTVLAEHDGARVC